MPLYSTACPLPLSRKIFRHRASAPFSPANLTGLSLWLKADAGVTTGIGTPFISSVIISGAGSTTSNGTYTRTSGGYTTFTKSGGNYIAYGYNSTADSDVWYISDATLNYVPTYYANDEGAISNWQIDQGSANAPSSTTSNTTPTIVTNWADQSGNGRDASPVDVSPTLNSSDLNSKPTISLSSVAGGTNKSLQIFGNPMGASGATAFVVNYVDSGVFGEDANGALLGNFGSASDGSHWPYGFTNSVYDSFATDTRKDDLGLPTGITDWNIYSVYSQDNDWKLFCNGTEFYSDSSNVYSNAVANSTSLYIGMQNNADSDQIFKGKVAEVVVYNRVLTTQERQQVEAYLNAKYAIY